MILPSRKKNNNDSMTTKQKWFEDAKHDDKVSILKKVRMSVILDFTFF